MPRPFSTKGVPHLNKREYPFYTKGSTPFDEKGHSPLWEAV